MVKSKNYAIDIDADTCFYVVGKLTTVTDKKTGEQKERLTNTKYYGSISQAIAGLREMAIREMVSAEDMQLSELIYKLEELDDKIRKALDFE